jgi:nicotinamide-nucleotide amidase
MIATELSERLAGRSIAVAESLTAGNLQALIAAVPGASRYFLGGVTAYNIDQKVRLLGVDRAVAEPVNCVSESVALQMAAGIRLRTGADVGVATTGYAEAWGAVAEPMAWIAVETSAGTVTARVEMPGLDRAGAQRQVSLAALQLVIDVLERAQQN